MGSSRLAFAAVGLACVIAAGAGSYLATRHNVADSASASVAASEAPARAAAASTPVQETEGVVGDAPSHAAASPDETTSTTREAAAVAERGPGSARTPTPRTPSSPRTNAAAGRASRPSPSAAPRPQARVEQPPTLDRSWPSADSPAPASPADPTVAPTENRAADTASAPEPAEPTFEELTVAADSVIGLETETALSSERARVEDRVEARVARDVRVDGRVAIPAGTRALGSVVVVERGGKVKERARLGIRFHTLALADGTQLPITTETIYRYGEAPGNGSGAIIGGGKGAAIGATAGAAGGGATVMAGDRSEATFPSGAQVTARILSPITVTVDR